MTTIRPSSRSAVPLAALVQIDESGTSDKRGRILGAALALFVRHGIRRTSIDDVAREAGIAKGTVYLYFDSKDALFDAVAGRICAQRIALAEAALESPASIAEQVVGILDAHVGMMYRLVAGSPHLAELTESRALSSAIYDAFDAKMMELLGIVLSKAGLTGDEPRDMFFAAAVGMTEICGKDEQAYRNRLTAMVETLLAGLSTRITSQQGGDSCE
jgi:AcrR family transcriptional regulator